MDSSMTVAHVAMRMLETLTQYRWMTIAAAIFGFIMSFGIGANDVANAFATSVSAKSVTLKQAVLIASVCEFLGAILLGSSVTSTIRSSVIDIDLYEDEPDVLMYGMLTSLVAASFILMVANYLALPVSTTHTIVGAIIGFSLAAKGFSSVNWMTTGMIFISWVASPLITGLLAVAFFWLCRRFVLLSDEPYKRAIKTYPLIIFLAVGLDLFMVLYKAGKNNAWIKEQGVKFSLPVAFATSFVLAVIWQFVFSPCVQRKIEAEQAEKEAAKEEEEEEARRREEAINETTRTDRTVSLGEGIDRSERTRGSESNDSDERLESEDVLFADEATRTDRTVSLGEGIDRSAEEDEERIVEVGLTKSQRLKKGLSSSLHKLGEATINRDIESQAFAQSERARAIWDQGEEYDSKTESMFSYLQVLTACLLSFAHGANDVSNAIAPVSAVFLIYETGSISSEAPVQKWVLALGGFGIVLGLLLYGYKLMISLGYMITKLSPSRGFCIELAASTIVVIASFIGIPVSTTQCQVGGTAGVGLMGGTGDNPSGKQNVDLKFFVKVCAGWVFTFLAVVIINAGIFAFAFYAPSAEGFE